MVEVGPENIISISKDIVSLTDKLRITEDYLEKVDRLIENTTILDSEDTSTNPSSPRANVEMNDDLAKPTQETAGTKEASLVDIMWCFPSQVTQHSPITKSLMEIFDRTSIMANDKTID